MSRLASRLFALLIALSLAASLHAQTESPPADDRTPLVEVGGSFEWLVWFDPSPEASATSPRDPKPVGWTVLRQRVAPVTEKYWTTVARLSVKPQQIGRFGERLAVLGEDGSWELIGLGTRSGGDTLPGKRRAVALTRSTRGGLIFLGVDERGAIDRLDWDGNSFKQALAPRRVNETTRLLDTPAGLLSVTILNRAAHLAIDDREIQTFPADMAWLCESASGDAQLILKELDHYTLHRVRGGAIVRSVSLTGDTLKGLSPTFSTGGDGVAAWWADKSVQSTDFLADGSNVGETIAVQTQPVVAPPLFERVLYILGAATFLIVLLIGGKQTLTQAASAAPIVTATPAPLARRFAAGVIDTFPVVVVVFYLAARGQLSSIAGILHFATGWAEAILAAAVILYLLLILGFELRTGASLGKRLFALKVLSIDGTRPRARAILVRNLLRIVDLNLITLIFIPLTPMRQRIGDFIGGTVVVDADHPVTSPEVDPMPRSEDTPD